MRTTGERAEPSEHGDLTEAAVVEDGSGNGRAAACGAGPGGCAPDGICERDGTPDGVRWCTIVVAAWGEADIPDGEPGGGYLAAAAGHLAILRIPNLDHSGAVPSRR